VAGGRTLVSVNGGRHPVWSGDGRELFYSSPEGMTVVAVDTRSAFVPGAVEVLFDTVRYAADGFGASVFDVAPDGQKFLMLEPMTSADGAATSSEIVLVQNWFTELRRLVPTP